VQIFLSSQGTGAVRQPPSAVQDAETHLSLLEQVELMSTKAQTPLAQESLVHLLASSQTLSLQFQPFTLSQTHSLHPSSLNGESRGLLTHPAVLSQKSWVHTLASSHLEVVS